jgi:2-polyprenyl-6-methoxyphenol hydroxylase-like FAD-dependent oxidoreductase
VNRRGISPIIVPPFTISLVKTDISILGSGIVSQVLALLLARARISVSISAPNPQASRDLRSFALNAASRQVLMDLRVWPEQACAVQQMHVYGDGVSKIHFGAQAQPLAWIVDAQALQEKLAAALGFSPDISVLNATEQPQSTQLNVICEGRASQTRQATGADFEQFPYDHTAIAAHLVCDKPHQDTAWQWMRSGRVCALLPRMESHEGNSVALVWSVPQSRATELMALAENEFAAELAGDCDAQLGDMRLVSERASWPLVLAQAQQWSGRKDGVAWVLAGDAAHAVHPLAGQGLNLGLGDAVELARILAAKPYFRPFGDARLLRQYERARKADAARLRLATDGLRQLFGSDDARLQSLRQWGMQGFDAAAPLKAWVMRQAAGGRSAS